MVLWMGKNGYYKIRIHYQGTVNYLIGVFGISFKILERFGIGLLNIYMANIHMTNIHYNHLSKQ